MSTGASKDRLKAVRRDSVLTVLTGPLKLIIPALAYFLLYPIIISRAGIEVVGVWSLLGAVVSFMGIADIGFSQLLTREAGHGQDIADNSEARADYFASYRAYWILFAVLEILFLIFRERILPLFGNVYPDGALTASILLVIAGSVIQLMGKLDSAILSACHDNYTIQVVSALSPVFTYVFALAGALVGMPIEGLAAGTVISGLFTVIVLRARLASRHMGWAFSGKTQSARETLGRLNGLTRRGWYLYGSSVGLLARGPVFRFVLAGTLGLQAAAIFDIAMRVTQTLRDAVASGFNVLYPSFSYLHNIEDRKSIIELVRVSLMVLLPAGAVSLGLLAALSGKVLALWLGTYPQELAGAVKTLAVWQLITMANVPFWFLLQATRNEKTAAASVWAHTAAILVAYPLQAAFRLDLMELLVYWTATSVLTQALIYYHIQSKLKLFWAITASPRLLAALAAASLFFLGCCLYDTVFNNPGRPAFYGVAAASVFLFFMLIISGKPLFQFMKSAKKEVF